MSVAELPAASMDSLLPLLATGGWAFLAFLDHSGGYDLIDDLLPAPDDPESGNYSWFRVLPEDRHGVDSVLDVGLEGQAIAVVSLYEGEPSAWLLDELGGRDPEDVIALMDEHAGAMEAGADSDW